MKEKSPKKYRIETLLGRLLALLTLVLALLAVASGPIKKPPSAFPQEGT